MSFSACGGSAPAPPLGGGAVDEADDEASSFVFSGAARLPRPLAPPPRTFTTPRRTPPCDAGTQHRVHSGKQTHCARAVGARVRVGHSRRATTDPDPDPDPDLTLTDALPT